MSGWLQGSDITALFSRSWSWPFAPTVEYIDGPDQFLGRYVTGSTQNWGRFSDPRLDDLFSRQARSLDLAERQKLVSEPQKITNQKLQDVWL